MLACRNWKLCPCLLAIACERMTGKQEVSELLPACPTILAELEPKTLDERVGLMPTTDSRYVNSSLTLSSETCFVPRCASCGEILLEV